MRYNTRKNPEQVKKSITLCKVAREMLIDVLIDNEDIMGKKCRNKADKAIDEIVYMQDALYQFLYTYRYDDFKDYEDIRYMDERKREAVLEWLDRRYGTEECEK